VEPLASSAVLEVAATSAGGLTFPELVTFASLLLATITGVGSLLLARRTVRLTQEQLTAGHRHRVFDTQVQAHVEIAELVATHCRVMRRALLRDSRDMPALWQTTGKEFDAIPGARDKWAAYLPDQTLKAIEEYGRVCESITTPRSDSWPLLEDLPRLQGAYHGVITAMRQAHRVEALQEVTLRAIGLSSEERAAADLSVRLARLDTEAEVLSRGCYRAESEALSRRRVEVTCARWHHSSLSRSAAPHSFSSTVQVRWRSR
jgi:hypothetical protein